MMRRAARRGHEALASRTTRPPRQSATPFSEDAPGRPARGASRKPNDLRTLRQRSDQRVAQQARSRSQLPDIDLRAFFEGLIYLVEGTWWTTWAAISKAPVDCDALQTRLFGRPRLLLVSPEEISMTEIVIINNARRFRMIMSRR